MSDRPLVFGILNVTPDSFSDGGRFAGPSDAVAAALRLVDAGADYVDVGGESTRPHADPVPIAEEQRRVVPVIEALVDRGVPVSIDTMHAATARAALVAGAAVVNDVSGGLGDPEMAVVVAEAGVPFVAMHWRGPAGTPASYTDVVAEVRDELAQRVEALTAAGISRDRILLDPGLGFAKDAAHNWQLLGALPVLNALGQPLLIGASRKRFLGALPSLAGREDATARDLPTAVLSALLSLEGVAALRVHDVAATVAALDVADAWRKATA
ncbi:dihydropteroate synthase [Naasia aerilata]|uniref:Dihydropteroate synthase n=1 Tax=Naasia aerilata TaxID=1162966 RepID=A0ABN6XJW8_9MICO|nr:dihydropteroate synthase [Naasia aerilata]BDZ45192.1 dihydropteroate synthase [Naasia aerilata]